MNYGCNMFTVIFDNENGNAVRDVDAKSVIDNLIKADPNGSYSTGCEAVVHAARVLVYEGKVSHKNIKFYFKGNDEDIYCDKNGSLANWPDGFCDCNEKFMTTLCGWDTEKMNADT